MSVPHMNYFLDKLEGFSTNHFKLMPQGSSSASANSIIRITLPSASLVNMRSFALHFDAAITSAGGECRLPNKISSLIERVELKIGGVQVQSGCNAYNVLCHAKQALMGDKTCKLLGHPEVIRAESYHKASHISSNKETSASYVINDWEGFFNSVEPPIMDLGLVGDAVVSIYLATNNVCIDAKGSLMADASSNQITVAADTPNPVYALTNIYASIEAVGMSTGVLDNLIAQKISSRGFIELPFKNYIDYRDTTNTSMRFGTSVHSLDRIWIVHRPTDYNTVGGAVKVAGYLSDTTVSEYDKLFDYNTEKYISKYFNFPEINDGFKMQLQLNGSLYPQWQASLEDWVAISKNSVEKADVNYGLRTLKSNYAVQCARFNLPDSEKYRIVSGIDTRSNSINAFVNFYDAGATAKPINLFIEATSILRIGAGGQAEVIQ